MLDQPKSVEIISEHGNWIVRIREYDQVVDRNFDRLEHAESFAAGQAFRLGVDEPIRSASS